MKRWWGLLPGLLVLPGHAESLRMLLAPVPGIMEPSADGKQSGDGVDLMQAISRRSGIAFQYEFYPQARAMLLTQQQADACTPIAQLQNLKPMFKWSAPILPIQIVLVARADDARTWSGLEQARKLRVGALRGSMVEGRLKQLGFFPEESADFRTGLRKLQQGHLDLWGMVDVGLSSASSKLDLPPPRVALVVERSDVALACNNKVSDEAIAALNQAIAAMRKDGSIQKFPLR
ncbi:substrate-binding periplasmic protein [Chromobacterium amazonense]|uniref:substrate-binding periplasmic protein n=1 Tax=Chromobacterium amazonense TaxID=1382803 RepID=UPI003F7A62E8